MKESLRVLLMTQRHILMHTCPCTQAYWPLRIGTLAAYPRGHTCCSLAVPHDGFGG